MENTEPGAKVVPSGGGGGAG
eukprot:COSAG01_NODE_56753_length_316_cov_0.958525_2_plen_20_part_01